MSAELDPRQIAAAHVGFPGEGLLTQAMGRPQPLELLRQGVHADPLLPISHSWSLDTGQSFGQVSGTRRPLALGV